MDGFRSELYGDRAAATYDDRYADFPPSDEMLALLREYAGSGPVVEIGVGTGRVAIPLAKSGVRITGVDVSRAMIDRLAENVGPLPVDGLVADAASFALPTRATLIYCVFNTLYQIERQAAFLRNAAGQLTDDGLLLIEIGIFRPEQITAPTGVSVSRFDAEQVVLQVYSLDRERQIISKQEAILRDGEPVQLVPSVQHYLSPDQIVSMAGECGLVPAAQYASWSKEPLTPHSDNAIIVLRKRA
jgi:SAM-dependent methyltransferase